METIGSADAQATFSFNENRSHIPIGADEVDPGFEQLNSATACKLSVSAAATSRKRLGFTLYAENRHGHYVSRRASDPALSPHGGRSATQSTVGEVLGRKQKRSPPQEALGDAFIVTQGGIGPIHTTSFGPEQLETKEQFMTDQQAWQFWDSLKDNTGISVGFTSLPSSTVQVIYLETAGIKNELMKMDQCFQ